MASTDGGREAINKTIFAEHKVAEETVKVMATLGLIDADALAVRLSVLSLISQLSHYVCDRNLECSRQYGPRTAHNIGSLSVQWHSPPHSAGWLQHASNCPIYSTSSHCIPTSYARL